jgi:peroxiredoxin
MPSTFNLNIKKMNKLFSILALGFGLLMAVSCNNAVDKENYNFKADVTVNGAKDGDLVYFKDWADGKWVVVDSAKLKDSKAELEGNLDYPTMYFFFYNNLRLSPVFVEPGNFTIKTDKNNLRDVKVEGSVSHNEYQYFMTDVNGAIDKKIQELGAKYGVAQRNGDKAAMDSLTQVYEALEDSRKDEMITFAKKNNKSVVPAYLIYQNSYQFTLPELVVAAKAFDTSISNNKYVKNIKERVAILEKVQVGKPYIDFTQNDTAGNPVSLSSVVKNNKYVLVDFWAAWCKPCRAENPNVVAAYKKYHDKGFTVFGVSFDRKKVEWLKAIKDDGLMWTQVSDLKGWGNEAGKLYGIQSIPQNILIGPDGKIVARNIRGQALQDKLKELMP